MEQTEKMLEEMLENLLDSDEYNESCEESSTPQGSKAEDENITEEQPNSNRDSPYDSEDNEKQVTAKSSKTTIAEELKKLRDEFPIETDVTTTTLYKSSDTKQTSSQESDVEANMPTTTFFDEATAALRNEVARVFAAQSELCPESNTAAYYDAAQEYAIYGEHFLDFLQDFDKLYLNAKLESEVKAATTTTNLMSDQAANEQLARNDATTNKLSELPTYSGNNNSTFREVRPTTTMHAISQNKPLRAVATAGAATAATYYQLCSSLQPALRPGGTVNSAVHANTAAVNASILLNNNLNTVSTNNTNPYVNSPYQAASNITANICFSPNSSLSPAITTQQNSNNISNVSVTGAAGDAKVFEHIVYAQLLQQQLSQSQQQQLQQQQRQQVIAATTIFQQQLLLQQQTKMAALQRHVARVADGTAALPTIGINVATNRCMQRFTAPSQMVSNQQAISPSALANSPTVQTSSANSFGAENITDANLNNFRAPNNGPN